MSEMGDDEDRRDPIEELRAADPAAGIEPREGFADEVVARVAAETAGAASPVAEPETTDAAASARPPVADLGAERTRRRPRWIPVAAVAASLAVVGAVGYGVGAATGQPANLADAAAPPISLQGQAGAGALEGSLVEPGAVDQRMAGPGAADLSYPYGFGRNAFHADGLSTTAGTAAAYAFDAPAASDPGTIAALAAALGVAGEPVLADGAWTVGPQDGTAPTLWVSLDGTMSFSYSDPGLDPWMCEEGADVCEPSGDIPSEDAAIDALRDLLASAGRDPGAYEFSSETWEGAVTRTASAWPVVDGQRIDTGWSVEVTDDGLYSAYGALAELVPLGDYPVVSEQEAFERLSDPRFGAQMTIMPFAVREQASDEVAEWVPPTDPPAVPSAGTPLSWPVNDVDIVEARLGLASQWQPDGSVLVVPAFEFTDSDGGAWSVVAVADERLDFSMG
ncbi:hypothetical protein GCM10009571_17560 [Agromyces luteolus]|uniref:Uncharacterized protein n=1 Tax=Agromyces luteolus TaxID=88373 RepID=A0A7C9HJT9_9MICO|nr:hypothetical protein [Agromyces luteolus]MUN08823.1 hypothetical protein [Agromyces luteolus]